MKTIGIANSIEFHFFIKEYLYHDDPDVVVTAIQAAGTSKDPVFITDFLQLLTNKKYRPAVIDALHNYGSKLIPILANTITERKVALDTCRLLPGVLKSFASQEAVRYLLRLMEDSDLGVRLEAIRALSDIRKSYPRLKFDKYKVVALIFEECKLHHQTLSAMHTQIIVSYRNRTKARVIINEDERDARSSLLELLERRLDAGLERIFKLLGLRYPQKDIEIAYEGLMSTKQEARTNAVEFLDNLLTGDLKRELLPIIEASALDTDSEEVLQKIKHKVPSEMECFKLLLDSNDLKLKLAVLYLIRHQKDDRYKPLIAKYRNDHDLKLRTFAEEAWEAIVDLPKQ